MPFGYDGAGALPFGFGLDLTFGTNFMLGFDVPTHTFFGSTRLRRIKTAYKQPDLLLLQKACAYKDFGMIQRFNLYYQFYKIIKGFSLEIGYQYLKRGDDTFSLSTNNFSNDIANSALSLEEITMHQIIVDASYDFSGTSRF